MKTKEEKELEEMGRRDVRKIVMANLELVKQVINVILKDAFKQAPTKYKETLKEKFMYKYFVHNANNQSTHSINQDENEFFQENVVLNDQAKIFIANNQRWINFYKMNAIGFCMNLVELTLTGEVERVERDIDSLNKLEQNQREEQMRNEIFN